MGKVLMLLILMAIVSFAWCKPHRNINGGNKLDRISVSTKVHHYQDKYGRVRIFHGSNSVKKGFPWYQDHFTDYHLDLMKKFGFNIMRLGAMWTGAEPTRDEFNQTYINKLKDIVDRLASRGIYTMMDMHQDVMSTKFGGYDGVPLWLVENYPAPRHAYPWPLSKVGYWEEGYATEAVGQAFENFYTNVNGSVDEWVEFWGYIADNFKDNPNVIGYDLINEPWVGDWLAHPELVLPGLAAKKHLVPAYDKINARIRQSDKEGIIFFEPMIYGQAAKNINLGSGFDRVPGGESYRNVSSYNFHMYCWALEFIGENPTDAQRREARDYCHNELFPQFFEAQRANIQRFGGASILSEFGICRTFEDEINVECRSFMDLADQYFVSWNQWDFNWLFANGQPVTKRIEKHVRTYAMAVAGIPITMTFNDDNLDFTLEFLPDPKISQPTEIFVPSMRYIGGYHVKLSRGLKSEIKGDMLYVYNAEHSDVITSSVTIKAGVPSPMEQ